MAVLTAEAHVLLVEMVEQKVEQTKNSHLKRTAFSLPHPFLCPSVVHGRRLQMPSNSRMVGERTLNLSYDGSTVSTNLNCDDSTVTAPY